MVDIPRRLPRAEVSSVVAIGGDGLSGFTQRTRGTRGSGPRASRYAVVFFSLFLFEKTEVIFNSHNFSV